MKRKLLLLLSIATTMALMAANTITTVSQVTSSVTLSNDVDYVVTSTTPFNTTGSVNITNTEHAVLIIKKIKPSLVIKNWLANHVFINGEQAKNGTNCQVKMYAGGTIIMPYSSDIKPLTVYSEQNFGGTAVNDFGLESSGGYMNTLTADKLNNQIRSFKLKRGYMVTFSTRSQGRGYSRCFIADSEDLEFAVLPTVLDKRISSYRVFQWYDSQKKCLANDTRDFSNDMLNTTSCYSFGLGETRLPDQECIPHHIYEDWPSPSACGSVNYSCHMKTNNEPGNSSDDHPQDVATVLANWENLMRTGMRLCSESSHDGSWGHLRAFIDSIDARGWRCDILDLHCYWASGFDTGNMARYYANYGNRPIWISEWVWGASWNNNGIFATDRTYSKANQQLNADKLKEILPALESSPHVERYYYWNSEAPCSQILNGSSLSIGGEYYAGLESALAYRKQYEHVPKNPPQRSPANLKIAYDDGTQEVTLTWNDYNGEYNQLMSVQVKKPGGSWTKVQDIEQKETEAKYTLTTSGLDGYQYRIYIKDLNGTARYSNEVTAVNGELVIGGSVTVGENRMFLGGNLLPNGDFELGLADWQNGAGNALAAPYYQAIPLDGADKGAFLQCYGNSTSNTNEQSVLRIIDAAPGESYYVSMSGRNTNSKQRIYTTRKVGYTSYNKVQMSEVSAWDTKAAAFTCDESKNDTLVCVELSSTAGTAQLDKIMVSKLFPTREEALADGRNQMVARINLFKEVNTKHANLNAELDELVASDADVFALEDAVFTALNALKAYNTVDSLEADVAMLSDCSYPGADKLCNALETFKTLAKAQDIVDAAANLKGQLAEFLKYTTNTTAIQSPSFAATTGWNTKAGTYKDGDQRSNTVAGKSCWNAWWSVTNEGGKDKTMEINQEITGLAPGLYALECLAGTQHLCETDQHAFIKTKNSTVVSQPLSLGVLDIPTFSEANMWQSLVTPYIYIDEGDTITIGFCGSKDGAINKQWIKYGDATNTGDNREGWWCATDFKLRYVPMLFREAGEGGWGTVCLPRIFNTTEGVKLYNVVGITTDSLRIAVEEETGDVVAGRPYVFRCEKEGDIAAFYPDMTTAEAKSATTTNGLRGTFLSTSRYSTTSLRMVDGVWEKAPSSRPYIQPYSAYINNAMSALTKLDQWTGEYILTKGFAPNILGDADGDGVITMADANMIVNYYLGVEVSGIRLSACDLDFDGVITMADANIVVNMYLGAN